MTLPSLLRRSPTARALATHADATAAGTVSTLGSVGVPLLQARLGMSSRRDGTRWCASGQYRHPVSSLGGGKAAGPVAKHRRHDEPVRGPDGHEVRAAGQAMEPNECGDHAEPLFPVVEHANGEAEVEVPVIKAEHDLVSRLGNHGEDADVRAATIRDGGFER